MKITPPRRRRILIATAALLGAPAVWRSAVAQPALPTPAQTEGPFYPVALPADSDFDLLANGALRYARGRAAWLEGRVTDTSGRALAGAAVEIWQCDADGHYHHPGDGGRADPAFQGFGRVTVGSDASYRFRTLQPVAYSGRAPHIHLKVRQGTRTLLTTQVYVEGDPGNARDFLWRSLSEAQRAQLTVPYVADGDGLRARFAVVVNG